MLTYNIIQMVPRIEAINSFLMHVKKEASDFAQLCILHSVAYHGTCQREYFVLAKNASFEIGFTDCRQLSNDRFCHGAPANSIRAALQSSVYFSKSAAWNFVTKLSLFLVDFSSSCYRSKPSGS